MGEHKRTKVILIWALKGLITFGILGYLFQHIPVSRVIASLSKLEPQYVLAAIFLQIMLRYISAFQLKILLSHQKVRLSVIDLAKINFQTQFYGLLLPGVLSGGVVKWHKLSKQNKMRAQAAVCIVLSRTMHILSLAILGVGFFLFEMPHHSTQILPVMALGLVVAVLFYAAIMNTTISGAVEKFLNKLFFCRFPESIRTRINKLWGAVKSFHEIRFLTANYTLLLSFLFHLVRTISVYLVMRGLHVDISIISVVWITAVVMFVQLLPISISGLGVREGMFVFLLGKYGIPSSDAMAVSFTIFGFLVIVALIGGIFEAHEFLFQKKREEAPD